MTVLVDFYGRASHMVGRKVVKAPQGAEGIEKFDAYEYYKFVREEIKREDELTNQRLTATLTLQGLLIASSGFIISQYIQSSESQRLLYLLVNLVTGVIGFVISFYSLMGVLAARRSIDGVVGAWSDYNEMHKIYPGLAPQVIASGKQFVWGARYYVVIPGMLTAVWILYIAFIFALLKFPLVPVQIPTLEHTSADENITVAPAPIAEPQSSPDQN